MMGAPETQGNLNRVFVEDDSVDSPAFFVLHKIEKSGVKSVR